MANPRAWLHARSTHADLPIYFRRPAVPVAEFDALRPKYPRLLSVTHHLGHVMGSGLPEPAYNESLAALDAALTGPFDDEVDGLVALVETFAGKRTYYVYLAPAFEADAFMAGVAARFSAQKLSWKLHDDPTWRLFNGYAKDFQFA
ncbi:DUF695 domain-containing protein [Ramlibacter sp. USB13]|uniref:DUF695 domain-containing protein n=1 Tax=Ramlibacter cellulosilyticus TaxID=2764187 RepID=A0A923MP43_9BURK|nr:DUF695 domain-containing protein [Ramlibacter cellulosilyticus]MBC5781639.1 DUF695 domain-containing protein [Ramlibacter cellulosilyticus]